MHIEQHITARSATCALESARVDIGKSLVNFPQIVKLVVSLQVLEIWLLLKIHPWLRRETFNQSVIGKPYRSYVAIGDSLSEGLGDFTFEHSRNQSGWTDRLAMLLAQEASDQGYEFHFANLALRGSKLEKIVEEQLSSALRLQPDLVTVMAGSNDLMSRVQRLPKLRATLEDGVQQLIAAGCDVLIANTINPSHLRVFKPLRPKAELFSTLIETVADDFDLPLIDVFGTKDFEDIRYWSQDMVHFSGFGHIKLANQAAEILHLNYRYPEPELPNFAAKSRGVVETIKWVGRDVIPFFNRRLRGVTSGDGLSPKHLELVPLTPARPHPSWDLISV